MRDTDYAYAVARIRCNEMKLLSASDLELLLSQKSCEDCLRRLTDKGYGSQSGSALTEGELLSLEQRKAWELIDEISPDKSAFDSLKLPNDFHNLKVIMESFIARADSSKLCLCPNTVDTELILTAVKGKNFTLLPEYMRECAAKAYTVFVEARDSQLGEAIIDKACLEKSIELSKGHGELLSKLAELRAVIADIKIAFRSAKTKKPLSFLESSLAECATLSIKELARAAAEGTEELLDYLASGVYSEAADALREGISVFEKWGDAQILHVIEPAKYKSLGPDALAAYLLGKELELRSVRIILSGKRNGIDVERLRARIRELY